MIQFTSISYSVGGSWTFTWADQGASYYRIVLNGQQLYQQTGLSYTYSGPGPYALYPPPLEIAFEDQLVLSEQFPPFIVIQWYGEPGASYYLIQQLIGSNWTTLDQIIESGLWIYTYQTGALPDETIQQFQVIAVDSLGNQAAPRQYQVFVVRPPDDPSPNVAISYNASTTSIVVSAAS